MERLTDFKPLERVVLPKLGEIQCTGLVMVVGSNSTGKTQFLQDLRHRLVGDPRKLVVAEQIDIRKPDYAPFLECLKREGYLETLQDDALRAGNLQIRPRRPFVGSGEGGSQIPADHAKQWHSSFNH